MTPADQPYLHFLWEDGNQNITHTTTCHTSLEQPTLLALLATQPVNAQKGSDDKYPDLVPLTKRNLCMDDLYRPVSTTEEAIRLKSDLKHMFSLYGFILTKWTSNCKLFLQSVEEEHLGDKDSRNTDARPLERVLGVKWKPDSDQFLVEAKKFQTLVELDITQLILLKFAFSLFDPLGITMSLTIRLCQSPQLAWTSGPHWDKALEMTALCNLNDWIEEIEDFNNVELPGTYF